jgi:osmotically inducible protein OsmC
MPKRKSNATWEGGLKGGKGQMKIGKTSYEGPYSFASRFEEGNGTNPEELIAAAHAGCFSMALSADLEQAGHSPRRVSTVATVSVEPKDGGFAITNILLETEADVPGMKPEDFTRIAQGAKTGCPVSKALSAVNIDLEAKLVS